MKFRIYIILLCVSFAVKANTQITYSFTTCGVTGQTGPSQSQVNNTYTSSNTLYNSVTSSSGIQIWTVPTTGYYSIELAGAGGGSANSYGGRGAILKGKIYLTSGDVIKVLVGQKGGSATSTGGGGGSFVYKSSSSTLLIAAGGGGGKLAASMATYISNSDGSTNTSGNNSYCGTGLGGSSGAGGTGSNNGWGCGGGGYSTNGTDASHASGWGYTGLGYSFLNGGNGGGSATAAVGGFGGGGGTHGNTGGGGGGGGYSGGGGSNQDVSNNTGGGGGSFVNASFTNLETSNGNYNGSTSFNSVSIVNRSSYNTNDGYVTITYLYSAGTISNGQSQCGGLPYSPNAFSETTSPTGGSGTYSYQWQSSIDNSTFTDISGATNVTYTASTISSYTKIYYRRKVTDNTTPSPNIAYTNSVSITIDQTPTLPTASNVVVCTAGNTATLSGNAPSIGNGTWTNVSGPLTPIITNSSSSTSTVTGLSSNGTYVLRWTIASTNNVCSNYADINIVVGSPAITSTTNGSGCPNTNIALSAAANAGTINWYAASTGGSSLGTGTSFLTPFIASTTSYYVDATGNGCTTASRTAVTATINAVPTISVTGSTSNVDLVSLVASGGTTYSWSGGSATSSSTNTFDASGLYTITVTGANGCYTSTSVSVLVQKWGLNKYGNKITDSATQISYLGGLAMSNTLSQNGLKVAHKKSGVVVPVDLISTNVVTSITINSAISGGQISNDASFGITARGVVWGTSTNPTISNSKTINGTGVGSFTSNLTGLTSSTTYYLRAYATNAYGTSYGPEVTFTTN